MTNAPSISNGMNSAAYVLGENQRIARHVHAHKKPNSKSVERYSATRRRTATTTSADVFASIALIACPVFFFASGSKKSLSAMRGAY